MQLGVLHAAIQKYTGIGQVELAKTKTPTRQCLESTSLIKQHDCETLSKNLYVQQDIAA
jgi:hypothetical protein